MGIASRQVVLRTKKYAGIIFRRTRARRGSRAALRDEVGNERSGYGEGSDEDDGRSVVDAMSSGGVHVDIQNGGVIAEKNDALLGFTEDVESEFGALLDSPGGGDSVGDSEHGLTAARAVVVGSDADVVAEEELQDSTPDVDALNSGQSGEEQSGNEDNENEVLCCNSNPTGATSTSTPPSPSVTSALSSSSSSTNATQATQEALDFDDDVETELDALLSMSSGASSSAMAEQTVVEPGADRPRGSQPNNMMMNAQTPSSSHYTTRSRSNPQKKPQAVTVYVGNLPLDATEGDLRHIFGGLTIKAVRTGSPPQRNRDKPVTTKYMHVVFETVEDMNQAVKRNRMLFRGNNLVVQYSHAALSLLTGEDKDKDNDKEKEKKEEEGQHEPVVSAESRIPTGSGAYGRRGSSVISGNRTSMVSPASTSSAPLSETVSSLGHVSAVSVERERDVDSVGVPTTSELETKEAPSEESTFWRKWKPSGASSLDLVGGDDTSSASSTLTAPTRTTTTTTTAPALPRNDIIEAQARGNRGRPLKKGKDSKMRVFQVSDGRMHLGSALDTRQAPSFPGPKSNSEGSREGPPLRFLPIGGLGEIGMNCMLIAHYDRYILLDSGLMFPDFDEFGMQKVLPDTSFIARYKNKIEAIVITHGHEDHIGALPWVFPALDVHVKLYATKFTMQLVKKKMLEYGLWDEKRFVTINLGSKYPIGPFEAESFRVTHSIPDCIGLVLRCEDGTILHTGDWKIDEKPVDGEHFDREALERIGKEGVTLMMSDSTNVMSPGRTIGESDVEKNLHRAVEAYNGQGRLIVTQFASNLMRLGSVKRAADAAGRSMCLLGRSFETYMNCARLAGVAPFSMNDCIDSGDIDMIPDDKLLVVTTGSQGEPNAQLSLAASGASKVLKLQDTDRVLYSAKCIPGNDSKVMGLMNEIARCGTSIVMGRQDGLHCSGHGCSEEQREVIRLVNPQHFLPVHGEYTFLQAHAGIARECGVQHTSVIHDGQLLGVYNLRNRNEVSRSSATLMGEVNLRCFYNDGGNATGDNMEQRLAERMRVADGGMIIASVEIQRPAQGSKASTIGDFNIEVQCKCMYTQKGEHVRMLRNKIEAVLQASPADVSLKALEQSASKALRDYAHKVMKKRPDLCVFVHEVRDLNEAREVSMTHRTEARSGRINRNVLPPKPQSDDSRRGPGASSFSRAGGTSSSSSGGGAKRHRRTDRSR